MSEYRLIEGNLSIDGANVGIAVARFNAFVVESLLAGALDALRRGGVPTAKVTVVRVPGAFELPLVLDKMAASGDYDGLIALGAVIRGATTHYEAVADGCNRGIAQVSLSRSLPVVNAVLTTENIEQAIERAGSKAGNKGSEAGSVLIEMMNVVRQL
ncbi:MAG: 6,7-dimethyl-8-ribityllumazine synthase [Pseudomonadota bacterium]